MEGETFHAIMQWDRLERTGTGAGLVVWRDVTTGECHWMYAIEFNRMLENKETEWSGPLLIDGMWRMAPGKGGRVDSIKPVYASQLVGERKKRRAAGG